jgi:transposase
MGFPSYRGDIALRDFRAGAVRLVRETGKPVAQVARDLGINAGTLGTG